MKKLSIIKIPSVIIALLLLLLGLLEVLGFLQGGNSDFYNSVSIIGDFFYDLSLSLILLVIAFKIIFYSKRYHFCGYILIIVALLLLLTNIYILQALLRYSATQMYSLAIITNIFLEKLTIGAILISAYFMQNLVKNIKK